MSQQAFGAFDDATVGAAAFLSDAAWSGNDAVGNLKYSAGDLTSFRNYLQGGGWQLLGADLQTFLQFPGVDQSDGFYKSSNAVAFAATKGDTLAVSIRGIANGYDVPGAWSAVQATQYYTNVLPLINESIAYAQNDMSIKKIIITGASLGGETADLFAADASSQQILGRFSPADVSIGTFGSPGIPPPNLSMSNSPLISRVLDIYNSADPIYNLLSGTLGFVHVGTQKELYTPGMDTLSATPHVSATYEDEIATIEASKLFDYATANTVFVFGGDNSSVASATTLDAKVVDANFSIKAGTQHFLSDLGGNTTIIGDSGNDLINGSSGNDIMMGANGHNMYAALSGNDIITDFNPQSDSLWLPSTQSQPIAGSLANGTDSLLTYPGLKFIPPGPGTYALDGTTGTVTLDNVNLGLVASQYPWLQWSNVPYYTLGGAHA